jgi:hypothetical protein
MEKEDAPTWRETKGDTNGVPWRIRTLRIGAAELSLGEGFGDGVRASVTVYRCPDDSAAHADESAALRACATMLRDIADAAVSLAARIVREAQEVEANREAVAP